jgi:hypothetical protein
LVTIALTLRAAVMFSGVFITVDLTSMHSNLPHILCLTEHHMKQLELEHIHIENYNLGATYCRKALEKGIVNIFVHNLKFTKINLEDY